MSAQHLGISVPEDVERLCRSTFAGATPHPYTTADGRLMFWSVELTGKRYAIYCDRNGLITFKEANFGERKIPLYNWNQLATYFLDQKALIVENEDRVDALYDIGMNWVTCCFGGSEGIKHADWSILKPRGAVIYIGRQKGRTQFVRDLEKALDSAGVQYEQYQDISRKDR